MAGNELELRGLAELYAALRRLPEELRERGGQIVTENADEAADEIRAGYTAHKHTGNLADHVKVVKVDGASGKYGAAAIVKSTAKHAYIFENGTQVRKNAKGANRGAMPPGHVFVPIVIRKRRQMYQELQYLLVQAGLDVKGEA